MPERPYTKEELLTYLTAMQRNCYTTLFALTDERMHQTVSYPWTREQTDSFLELHLYTMRHAREHAARLSLFLGQHGIPDEALNSVARAKHTPGS